MRGRRWVVVFTLLAGIVAASSAQAEALRRQSVPIAGLRFATAYGEVEVRSGTLTVSWEPCREELDPCSRTLNVLLIGEAWSARGGERFVLQGCGSCEAEVGQNPLPPGTSIEVDGPSVARHNGTWTDVSVPFSVVEAESLRSLRGELSLRLLYAPGMTAPSVVGVSLVQA